LDELLSEDEIGDLSSKIKLIIIFTII